MENINYCSEQDKDGSMHSTHQEPKELCLLQQVQALRKQVPHRFLTSIAPEKLSCEMVAKMLSQGGACQKQKGIRLETYHTCMSVC